MTQGTRTFIGLGLLLAALAGGACGSRGPRPPLEPPQQPPEAPYRHLNIQVFEEHGIGLLGALVVLDDGQTRTTDGEGFVNFGANRSHDVVVRATGYSEYRTNLAPWYENDEPQTHRIHLTPDPAWQPKALNIVVHNERGRPVGGARIALDNGLEGTTDGNGFATFGVWRDHNLTIRLEGYLEYATNLAPWVDVNGVPQSHQVYLTRDKPAEPPPGTNPWPVVGRIRVIDYNQCFGDDTGCRGFTVEHAGDLVARWMYVRSDEDRAKILRDLDDIAGAGHSIVRTWWHLDVDHWPWNEGGDPPYPGVSAFSTPGFEDKGVEIVEEVFKRGMRITIGPGGVNRIGTSQEREMFHTFRRIIDRAGHEKFAWIEGVNEPSSTHATSDNDGDNQPGHLASLVEIAQASTGILWHLGYWSNNNYEEAGRYCVSGMSYNYVHGWRGGNGGNKIDRRTTWVRIFQNAVNKDFCRLTIDGESAGWPVTGPPLRYVSATENGHEMASAELQGLMAAGTALRGIPSHMSGTGVQRFESFTQSVGFRQIPWIVQQLPKDVHRWTVLHGGMNDGRVVIKATTNGNGVIGRVEQAVSNSGEFAAVAYNYHRPNQHQSFEFARTATFRVCDVEAMTCSEERTLHAGQRFEMDAEWGRVLIGRAQ